MDRSNWYDLWVKKIDYIEYQVSQFGKNAPNIRFSINYYIGMAETAISLVSNIKNYNYLTISHKRINFKDKYSGMYNPLNFILDIRVRDVSEYYKEKFFHDNVLISELITNIADYKMNSMEALLFFARLLFPTYYFDCYQEVLFGGIDEKEIVRYINKAEEYQLFLKEVYLFLRQYYDIPDIEWIIKT